VAELGTEVFPSRRFMMKIDIERDADPLQDRRR
jgi:hypothetical protein